MAISHNGKSNSLAGLTKMYELYLSGPFQGSSPTCMAPHTGHLDPVASSPDDDGDGVTYFPEQQRRIFTQLTFHITKPIKII